MSEAGGIFRVLIQTRSKNGSECEFTQVDELLHNIRLQASEEEITQNYHFWGDTTPKSNAKTTF